MKMKLTLIVLFVSISLSSVNAKETTFNMKKGELAAECILVSEGFGYWSAWFQQLGSSKNFRLDYATPSGSDNCPANLIEGEECEIIEDVSNSVDVTFKEGMEHCNDCTTTQIFMGTVINGSCKKDKDACIIDGKQGIVKNGECIDLV